MIKRLLLAGFVAFSFAFAGCQQGGEGGDGGTTGGEVASPAPEGDMGTQGDMASPSADGTEAATDSTAP